MQCFFVDPTTGFDGLADILENGLYELNTVADDGSLEELCIFFSHFYNDSLVLIVFCFVMLLKGDRDVTRLVL